MEYKYNDYYKFINVEDFENWIKDNIRIENVECIKLDAYLSDLIESYEINEGGVGRYSYELGSIETKSGHPELFTYEVYQELNGKKLSEEDFMLLVENEESLDDIVTVITFE